jgi:hypothetical protein
VTKYNNYNISMPRPIPQNRIVIKERRENILIAVPRIINIFPNRRPAILFVIHIGVGW